MKTTPLTTLKLTGTDATTFLQGMCTCDINTLTEAAILTACCNQKGRVIANFYIWKTQDAYFLQLPESMQDTLGSHLKKYRLRSAMNIETVDTNVIADKKTLWILPATTEQFTPQMIDLQKHGGVSFKKGCYLGQEIIARTEHLGQLKRHLQHLQSDHNNIHAGDIVTDKKQQKLGTVVTAFDSQHIYAVIEDRALEDNLFIKEKATWIAS